jgi:hypothetical protein
MCKYSEPLSEELPSYEHNSHPGRRKYSTLSGCPAMETLRGTYLTAGIAFEVFNVH